MIETAVTREGIVSGIQGDGCTSFLGLRYAAPPTGDLRWRAPQAAPTWNGTRLADRVSSVPMQPLPSAKSLYYPGEHPQSEDCLTLNIWSGAQHKSERRPVMVWFHLGAFMFGSSAWRGNNKSGLLFDGSALARLGAVVVTVNYRVGRLGFLSLPELSAESGHNASGNYGFLDQVAALEWVRDNIEEFGGNPENVTIFGVSAGSASSSLHMASPLSRGLFHRAIGGSGGFMAPPSRNSGLFDRLLTLGAAEERGEMVARVSGASSLDALRALPPEAILNAQVPSQPGLWYMEALGGSIGEGVSDTCYPIVDGYAVPDGPASIFERRLHNDVPLLTGSAYDDSTGLPGIQSLQDYVRYVEADMGPVAARALRTWSATDSSTAYQASSDLLADRVFGWQNWTWANLAHSRGTRPVYYYDWLHAPPVPEGRYLEHRKGASHAAEMPYVFDNLAGYDWPWTTGDRSLASVVSRYWVNFARNGDPNGEDLPQWPAFSGRDGKSMHFSEQAEVGEPTRRERFDVLDDYYGGVGA
ncbi:carboxylesterase/lipase family protein [Paraburkholderia fungorum]